VSEVGGFTLDLYCDFPKCTGSEQFIGETRAEARREAREAGWTIRRLRAPARSVNPHSAATYCPTHGKKVLP
jgi:hypothetical protein